MKKRKVIKKNLKNRKILISAIVLLVVFSLIIILNREDSETPNLSGMTIGDLHERTLSQSEVEEVIGGEAILMKRVDNVKTYTQAEVDSVLALNPNCDINVGDQIKVVAFYTSTREIGAIWLDNSGELLCVTQKNR